MWLLLLVGATVAEVVNEARQQPSTFTPRLVSALAGMSSAQRREGLQFTDANPRLRAHVIRLVARHVGPPLSTAEREALAWALHTEARPEALALLCADEAGRSQLQRALPNAPPDEAAELALLLSVPDARGWLWRWYLAHRETALEGPDIVLQSWSRARGTFDAQLRTLATSDAARGVLNRHDADALSDVEFLLRCASSREKKIAEPALLALLRYFSDPRVVALADTAATNKGPTAIRTAALERLGPRASRHLVRLLASPDRDDNAVAIGGLARIAGTWRRYVLKQWFDDLPSARFADPAWQPMIRQAGRFVEEDTGKWFGFGIDDGYRCATDAGTAWEAMQDAAILRGEPPIRPAQDTPPDTASETIALKRARDAMPRGVDLRQRSRAPFEP